VNHARSIGAAGCLLLGCLLSAPAVAASMTETPAAGSPAPAPPSVAPPTTPPTSGKVAEAFLTALKKGDYAAAFQMLDARMKAAVPQEKLQFVWEQQTARFGKLVSWVNAQGASVEGKDLLVGSLRFEHGELRSTMFVNPDTGEVSGFFIQPPPSKPVPPAPPAAYVDTTKFHVIDVKVGAEPFLLNGTVTMPAGKGPFPAAVLVHGSGPNDRDETIGPNKPFKDLAEGLASRGIAVLRYDKRTLQYGSRLTSTISLDDEVVLDAISAVNVLRARPEVDSARVFVIGHSLGALLAPEIGVRSGKVAGVALLAPPGRPPWELILSQMRFAGAPSADIADIERKAALLRAKNLGDEKLLGSPQSYWLDWAGRDGISMAGTLGRPVLVLHGERDFQVLEEDVDAWRRGLAGTSNVEIASMPGLNHLFIAGTGKPNAAEYNIPSHVDAKVVDKLASFISPSISAKH
jgi:dienelactone hydrolase